MNDIGSPPIHSDPLPERAAAQPQGGSGAGSRPDSLASRSDLRSSSPLDDYRAFLEAKRKVASSDGFTLDPAEINPALKDFVREAIVPWAARGGQRAIFSAFGLHKTSTQLQLARSARIRGAVPIISVPLGAKHEFFEEADVRFNGAHAVRLEFVQSDFEISQRDRNGGAMGAPPAAGDVPLIYITNPESVREGKLSAEKFGFVSLDEAAVLRGFAGSKTFRVFINDWVKVRWRFVASATPDPNEYIELLAYAEFLGIMDIGQAKTRFFKRDSERADKLTVHPHKEREFWLWVASWALFVRKPSDLGYPDDGYVMPALDVRWHEVPSDHGDAGSDKDGQYRLLKHASASIVEQAREKRDSLPARIARLAEIRAEDPAAHRIIWHDLEAERLAIEKAVPGVRSIYGSQPIETNERNAIDFKHGRFAELATKPQMSGAGCNFQGHCHWAIFLGIGHKFHDFIQAVHRLQRFGQTRTVRLDLIHTEAEREMRKNLEAKWARHDEQAERMAGIIREFGLAEASLASALGRSIGVDRREVAGEGYRLINNDCVDEARRLDGDSVDLIVTSIPFATQYEYTPSYNDFGHTDDNDHFWRQMDFLTPELYRVLRPGRVAAIHVKDRIVPGGMTGLGFQVVAPFHAEAIFHYRRHGFAFLGMKTIVTDVVRENNQTYRLGWTEQCKDGSRMGAGIPEYLLLFRKPQTDRTTGYADVPVVKEKPQSYDREGRIVPYEEGETLIPGTGYSRARWQLDAHGFMRSSGNRFLQPADLAGVAASDVWKMWKQHSLSHVYDFEHHVAACEVREARKELPKKFMLMPPHSWHPDVWTDITRMRTLNGAQAIKGLEQHLCPLQFDIVDRAIVQFSMKGETVLDPFAGLMTVPYCALKLGRKAIGIELAPEYFADGVAHVEAAARQAGTPTLFDLMAAETSAGADPAPEDLAEAAE